ncbi:MAG: hypothetical protein WCL24_10870 [Verrucomicrobiota bacterium]
MTGLLAVAGLAPSVLAKPAAAPSSPAPSAAGFTLRPDPRAVARRDPVA